MRDDVADAIETLARVIGEKRFGDCIETQADLVAKHHGEEIRGGLSEVASAIEEYRGEINYSLNRTDEGDASVTDALFAIAAALNNVAQALVVLPRKAAEAPKIAAGQPLLETVRRRVEARMQTPEVQRAVFMREAARLADAEKIPLDEAAKRLEASMQGGSDL